MCVASVLIIIYPKDGTYGITCTCKDVCVMGMWGVWLDMDESRRVLLGPINAFTWQFCDAHVEFEIEI